jgi:hypothetical protein
MQRKVVIAIALVAAALGGCTTSPGTNIDTLPKDGFASAPTSPAPPPGNVFFPSPGPHDHGSMGP